MSEISDTAVLVRLSGEGTYYIVKGSVKATLFLLQKLKRLQKAKLLSGGEVTKFEKFIKATDGKYKILNLPTEATEEIAKMREDFDKMKVRYSVLPDLNVGDGQIQVAYAFEDANKVENWYKNYCLDQMQRGGEKTYQDLMNLTEGQVSIVNIPWPDADSPSMSRNTGESLQRQKTMEEVLKSSNMPHVVMPDLNKQDGKRQIAVPAYSMDDFRTWISMNPDMQAAASQIEVQDINEYLKTGNMDSYTYAGTESEEIKEKLLAENQKRKEIVGERTKADPVPLEPGRERTLEELKTEGSGEISYAALPLLSMEDDLEKSEKSPDIERGIKMVSGKTGEPQHPFTKEASIQKLRDDLDRLHVNYTILPDLNVGDGYIQVAFASADAPRLQAWYEAYQEDMLNKGMQIEDMKQLDIQEYFGTGIADNISKRDRQPAETSLKPIDDAQVKSFQKTLGEMSDSSFMTKREYEQKKAQPNHIEISVNKDLVVSGKDDRVFVSRIPGTQGREYMCILPETVYETDGGKTFGILTNKDTKTLILDRDGNILREAKLKDIQQHYASVRENMVYARKEVVLNPERQSAAKAAKDAAKNLKGPKL